MDRLIPILKQTRVLTVAVALNFCLTLCVFPSVTTHVRSSSTSDNRFFNVTITLLSFVLHILSIELLAIQYRMIHQCHRIYLFHLVS
jgi:hypothetical protein